MSDAITSHSGLARIHRDVATRIHADPDLRSRFRVMAYGVGGPISTSTAYPFPNQSIRSLEHTQLGMVPMDLPDVWADHAGRYGDDKQEDSAEDLTTRRGQIRRGVLWVCWNASWCRAIAQPELLPAGHKLRDFLLQPPRGMSHRNWSALAQSSPEMYARLAERPFQTWLYCPVDGHCPDGTLGWQMAPILRGFDEVLAYTNYGSKVIEKTLCEWEDRDDKGNADSAKTTSNRAIPFITHGMDMQLFYPRDRQLARQTLVSRLSNGAKSLPLHDDQVCLAVVATNTSRKDWGLAFQVCGELLRRGMNVIVWGHTDALQAYWNLPAMARQFGMERRVMLTSDRLADEDIAFSYSACDAALGIGAGEGHGFPLFEAAACGLPVVHGRYAGGADLLYSDHQIEPAAYFLESPYMIQRPLFDPAKWADAVESAVKSSDWKDRAKQCVDALDWKVVWPRWASWLKHGTARD